MKNIFECAFSNKLSKKIVEDIFTNFHSYKIIIPHQHSLVKSLKLFDVEFFSRRCIYGGSYVEMVFKVQETSH